MAFAWIVAVLLMVGVVTPAFSAPSGARLYSQNCAACHGSHGEGGVGIPLALPDFLAVVDDDFLFKTIRSGRPGRVMPAFHAMSDAQVNAIVRHIRSFAPEIKAPDFFAAKPITGNAQRGKSLYAHYCANCHGPNGEGAHGTGVTFSRPRDFPIMPPALNNPGFLSAASDQVIKTTLIEGRRGTPMVSFKSRGMTESDIDDVVAYVRSFAAQQQEQPPEENTPAIEAASPYSLEETVENVKRAAVGKNFRIIRVQRLENGLFPEQEEDPNQVIVYFCNFTLINKALSLDPRVGIFMPCRITVVKQGDKVKVMAINPRYLGGLYNNAELNAVCEAMQRLYREIIEEATL